MGQTDETRDRLRSSGQYLYDNSRVDILVDNGPPDSKDVSTSLYRWDGERLSVSLALTYLTRISAM